tara:strand:- start:4667 stop:5170 length:504 start_codon:yes stop_codon:yes gene_type:complete
MQKKVLTEQALYFGEVKMPKHWEIDRTYLSNQILYSNLTNNEFLFSPTWDKLNRYITEHINLKYKINLINKKTWGNIYKPLEKKTFLLNVDPTDLKNSPDFTLLYGVNVENCNIEIFYDDNRRKGKSHIIPLKNNHFVMLPTTNTYTVINDQKNNLNFIQTISYEFI